MKFGTMKATSKKIGGLLGGLVLLGAAQANAAIIITDASTVVSIPALTSFSTTGADMDGMSVTAVFADGFSQTVAWADTGFEAGGVSGSDWGIAQSGTTFNDLSWSVSNGRNSLITDLLFDGAPGLTVFDIINGPEGTEGSANGKEFSSNLADDDVVVATYSHVVTLGAAPPVGDLFHRLHVSFADVSGGGAGSFLFTQDTDNDIRREVPVPATLLLLGTALLGLGWNRRKAS